MGRNDEPLSLDDDDFEDERPRRRRRPEPASLWSRMSPTARIGAVAGLAFLVLVVLCGTGLGIRALSRTRDAGGGSSGPSTSVTEDSVTVAVLSASVVDDELLVSVSVSTTDDRKRVNFTGWRRAGFGTATLTDDAGNRYAQKAFDPVIDGVFAANWNSTEASRRLKFGPGSVTSDQGRIEILVFPKPPPGVNYVDLELRGRAAGLSGTIRLRTPSSMWR